VPIGQVENLAEIFDRVRLTVAAEGFDLPASLRACIADSPDAIVASILRLHSKKAENERCRRAGLEFVAAEFSDSRLDALLNEAVGLTGRKRLDAAPPVSRIEGVGQEMPGPKAMSCD
jgi:hypothetical protein